ncbi:MAG: hypothetical protein Ct9H300mP31_19200 [Acidimicrobiaceae bacterium]|nr:MAG: hypothetical protein Ct9H300mP31_19200 [Acidimicrobiaceae bacterium]
MPHVSLDEIEQATHRALVATGPDRGGRPLARAVRVAESTGNRICGLYYLESYCTVADGRIDGSSSRW